MIRPRVMETRGSATGGRQEVREQEVTGVKQRAAGETRGAGGGERGLDGVHIHAL